MLFIAFIVFVELQPRNLKIPNPEKTTMVTLNPTNQRKARINAMKSKGNEGLTS